MPLVCTMSHVSVDTSHVAMRAPNLSRTNRMMAVCFPMYPPTQWCMALPSSMRSSPVEAGKMSSSLFDMRHEEYIAILWAKALATSIFLLMAINLSSAIRRCRSRSLRRSTMSFCFLTNSIVVSMSCGQMYLGLRVSRSIDAIS